MAVPSVCARVATLTVCVQSGLFIRRASSYHNPGNNPERVWVFMRFGMSGVECGKAKLETEIRSIKLESNSTGCRWWTYHNQVAASLYTLWVANSCGLSSVQCVTGQLRVRHCGFTSLSWFLNNRHKMDASYSNRVNRALLGRRLYSCQVGTHASTILPSATSCKRAQTSSVFSEASWPESAEWCGGAADDCENRATCTGAALQPCSSEVCEWVCVSRSRSEQFVQS